jgi:hypothetical protein
MFDTLLKTLCVLTALTAGALAEAGPAVFAHIIVSRGSGTYRCREDHY